MNHQINIDEAIAITLDLIIFIVTKQKASAVKTSKLN